MRVSLFIKSYSKDFDFLKVALKSIAKYYTGYHEIVIVVPEKDLPIINKWGLTHEIVMGQKEPANGYLFQQVVKLEAYKYVSPDTDFIQFVDSDVLFTEPVTPETFFMDGKPLLLKTRYDGKKLGGAECWKAITEKAIGFQVDFEYMRRNCLIFRKDTLEAIAKAYPNLPGYVMRQPNRDFSEFNFMGAFVERYESDKYRILDTEEEPFPPQPFIQFWSWGGMTDEVKNEIKKALE